jgi:hypothetical protein
MTARVASGSALGTQYDEFLFASVRDDGHGPLSVLSALARLDVDPWKMAATLAQLPRAAAVQRLASLFAGLPDGPADRDAIAARLVAFLPSSMGSKLNPPRTAALAGARAPVPVTRFMIFLYVLSMLAMLGVQGLAGGSHPSAQSLGIRAPAASKANSAPPHVSGSR